MLLLDAIEGFKNNFADDFVYTSKKALHRSCLIKIVRLNYLHDFDKYSFCICIDQILWIRIRIRSMRIHIIGIKSLIEHNLFFMLQ